MAESPDYKQRGSPKESDAPSPSPSNATPPQNPERLLCSELVNVSWKDPSGPDRYHTANLEEIWREGAILEMDEEVPVGVTVRLRRTAELEPDDASPSVAFAASFELQANVGFCHHSEIGYSVGVTFVGGSEWDPALVMPSHAVNPLELQDLADESLAPADVDPETNANDHRSDQSQRTGSQPSPETLARRRLVDSIVEQGSLFQLANRTAGV